MNRLVRKYKVDSDATVLQLNARSLCRIPSATRSVAAEYVRRRKCLLITKLCERLCGPRSSPSGVQLLVVSPFSLFHPLLFYSVHIKGPRTNSRGIKKMEGPLAIYFIGLVPRSCCAFFPSDVELFRIRPTAPYSTNPRLFERRFYFFSAVLQHPAAKSFISLLTAKYRRYSTDVKTSPQQLHRFLPSGLSRLVSHRYPTNLFTSTSQRAVPTAVRKQSVCSLGSDLADVCNSNRWNQTELLPLPVWALSCGHSRFLPSSRRTPVAAAFTLCSPQRL